MFGREVIDHSPEEVAKKSEDYPLLFTTPSICHIESDEIDAVNGTPIIQNRSSYIEFRKCAPILVSFSHLILGVGNISTNLLYCWHVVSFFV
jgi:hypothetical protein